MEKRRHRRYSKRLKVRFGEKGLTHTGFSGDVSSGGMFIVTTQVPKLGTRLHLEMTLDVDRVLTVEAVVARLTLVSPELRQLMKSGFGTRFLLGAELLAEMVPHMRDKNRVTLTFETSDEFLAAYEKELKRGGAFVWLDEARPIDTIINLEVDAPFLGRVLSFEARVVHVVPGEGGRFGTALMFLDAASAATGLSQFVLPK